jgi:hypothetical protein
MNDVAATSPVVRPHWGWFALLDGGLALLCAVSFSDRTYRRLSGIARLPFPRRGTLRLLLGGAVTVHVVEAMGAERVARRRDLPARDWALQTLVVGFPSLVTLRGVTCTSNSVVERTLQIRNLMLRYTPFPTRRWLHPTSIRGCVGRDLGMRQRHTSISKGQSAKACGPHRGEV